MAPGKRHRRAAAFAWSAGNDPVQLLLGTHEGAQQTRPHVGVSYGFAVAVGGWRLPDYSLKLRSRDSKDTATASFAPFELHAILLAAAAVIAGGSDANEGFGSDEGALRVCRVHRNTNSAFVPKVKRLNRQSPKRELRGQKKLQNHGSLRLLGSSPLCYPQHEEVISVAHPKPQQEWAGLWDGPAHSKRGFARCRCNVESNPSRWATSVVARELFGSRAMAWLLMPWLLRALVERRGRWLIQASWGPRPRAVAEGREGARCYCSYS